MFKDVKKLKRLDKIRRDKHIEQVKKEHGHKGTKSQRKRIKFEEAA